MASITLAATLNTPMSEVPPATMERILVIEHDRACRRFCSGFSPRKDTRLMSFQAAWLVWRCFVKDLPP